MLVGGIQRAGLEVGLPSAELEERYAAYRRRQASLLARVLPREAIRPLYRRARNVAPPLGPEDDPLAVLLELCEKLLPLPPFEVWRADLVEYPEGHLDDLGDWADAPAAEAPFTLALRTLRTNGSTWLASLRAYRDTSGWRALIAFEDESGGRYRTAGVFHEHDPVDLKDRFMSFDEPALSAFLRSALP